MKETEMEKTESSPGGVILSGRGCPPQRRIPEARIKPVPLAVTVV